MRKLLLVLFAVCVMGSISFAAEDRPYKRTVGQVRSAKDLCDTATTYILTVSSTASSIIPARTHRESIRLRNLGPTKVKIKLYYNSDVITSGYEIDVATNTSVNSPCEWYSEIYNGAIYIRQSQIFAGDVAPHTSTVQVIEEYR